MKSQTLTLLLFGCDHLTQKNTPHLKRRYCKIAPRRDKQRVIDEKGAANVVPFSSDCEVHRLVYGAQNHYCITSWAASGVIVFTRVERDGGVQVYGDRVEAGACAQIYMEDKRKLAKV